MHILSKKAQCISRLRKCTCLYDEQKKKCHFMQKWLRKSRIKVFVQFFAEEEILNVKCYFSAYEANFLQFFTHEYFPA